jgi:alkylation response protein AidB-like acyl-CoA dehydrogenase
MDFSLTEDQISMRGEVIRFARRELNDDVIARDAGNEFSREGWRKCARMGIQGLPFPKEHGGSEVDLVTTAVVMQALGYACADHGLLFSIAAQMVAVQMPLAQFGTEEQKRRYLGPLCAGEMIGAYCLSEPGSGSDAFGLSTTATRDGDRYVLNGSKTFITNAPVADVFLVFATTDKSAGFMGVTAFLLEKGAPGLTVGKPIGKLGLRTSPTSEVFFQDCVVPAGNRLGKEGMGQRLFTAGMQWERSLILAFELGAMERQIEACVSYAGERKQFGQPIGSFQSVAHRIVDMKVRFETSRLLLYHAAWLLQQGRLSDMEAAMTKLYVSESCLQSSLDAIQIHGGYGYTTECQIERGLRDAVGARIYSGTSEIQRNTIARSLGL